MKINKSILKYLGLTLILVVGVLSLGWHGDEYLSFTVYAGNSLARTAKSLLAQVSSSVSSPIVSSVDLMGSGVVGNSWQVGTTNTVTWSYGNFSPTVKTVSLSLCNPITSGSFEYCILMSHGPDQPQNKVVSGDGQIAGTATSLQPLGQAVVSKHINPYYHLSVEEKKAKGALLAAAFSGYRTRIKVCPTDDLGQTPGGARCAYSQIYYVSDPANPPPSSEPSVTTFPPTVFTVNISGSGMVSNTRWQVGTSNTLSWTYKDFSSTAKTVSLSLCNPALSGTNEYCILMSRGPNQPQNKVVSGDGQVAGTATSLQPLGQAVVSNYINPYYYLSINEKLAKGAKLAAAFDGYKTRAKICPTDATGQVPVGAVCAYSEPYEAYDPVNLPPRDPSLPLLVATVSNVTITGANFSASTGWKVGTSNTFKWKYGDFSNFVKTVSLSLCNPSTVGSDEYCFLMSRGSGLEQNKVPSGTGDPTGTSTSLQPLGSNVVSIHLNPNYYLSLEEKKAKGALFAAAFDGYKTRAKICPTDATGQVPVGAVCAYSEPYEAYDPVNPLPRTLTSKLIKVVWQDLGDRLVLKSGPVVEINRAYPGAQPFYFVESSTVPTEGYYTAKLYNESGTVISQYGIQDPYAIHISFPATCFKANHEFDLEKCGITPEINAKFTCRPEAKRLTITENSTGRVVASVNLALTAAMCAN